MHVIMRLIRQACALSGQGRQSPGVRFVSRDCAEYGAAIADLWKEQTLHEIIKLRLPKRGGFPSIRSSGHGFRSSGTTHNGFSPRATRCTFS
jgi:hypothetical protein